MIYFIIITTKVVSNQQNTQHQWPAPRKPKKRIKNHKDKHQSKRATLKSQAQESHVPTRTVRMIRPKPSPRSWPVKLVDVGKYVHSST
jgi:hypothetical protein